MEFKNLKLDRSIFALTVIRFEFNGSHKVASVELNGRGGALVRCPGLDLEGVKRLITAAGFNKPSEWEDTGQGIGFRYKLLVR